jgi:hypothetical protein
MAERPRISLATDVFGISYSHPGDRSASKLRPFSHCSRAANRDFALILGIIAQIRPPVIAEARRQAS